MSFANGAISIIAGIVCLLCIAGLILVWKKPKIGLFWSKDTRNKTGGYAIYIVVLIIAYLISGLTNPTYGDSNLSLLTGHSPAAPTTAPTTNQPARSQIPIASPLTQTSTTPPTSTPPSIITSTPLPTVTIAPTPLATPTVTPKVTTTPLPTTNPTNNPTPYPTQVTQQPSQQTYVGSVNSNVFHYPWCADAKKIKSSNLITFSSRQDAINHGYHPCKVCNP